MNGFSPKAGETAAKRGTRLHYAKSVKEPVIESHLYPVTMHTRAPLIDEQGYYMPDKPRCYTDLIEPFIVTIRRLGGGGCEGY